MSDYKLILGDCREEIPKLINDGIRVDLTVTSPPYDNQRSYNNEIIWNFDVFKECANLLYDITSDGGVVIWVVNDSVIKGSESGTSFRQALYFKDIGFRLHDTMIFQKANYVPLTHNRYEQAFEYMFCFSKGKPKTFNPIRIPCKNAGKIESYGSGRRSFLDKKQAMRAPEGITYMATKDTKLHPNIFTYTLGGQKSGHPAVFPNKLAQDQILSWSNENDIVFDPFLGSGTVGVISVLNNRKFIGIEKVEKYYNIALKRFENETKDL
jgi:site-specific DNA-methyltransferase (adenine-specific)